VSAELVIATPLLLLMLLAIVQFALWSHATHIAQAAASQGLAAARVQDGTAADCASGAQHVLDDLGRGPLDDTRIDCARGVDTATVHITGHAAAVVPFLHLPVRGDAAGRLENWAVPR
jgi:hypothetical protein